MCLYLRFYTAESWLSSFPCCLFCRYIIHSDDHNPYLTSMEKFAAKLADFKPDLLVVGGLQMMDSFPFQSGIWANWLLTFILFDFAWLVVVAWGVLACVIYLSKNLREWLDFCTKVHSNDLRRVCCLLADETNYLTDFAADACCFASGWETVAQNLTDIEPDSRVKLKSVWPFIYISYRALCQWALSTFPVCPANNTLLFSDPRLGYETTPVNGQNGINQKTSLFSSFLKDLSVVKTEPFLLSVSPLRFFWFWWHNWTHGELEVMNIDSSVWRSFHLFSVLFVCVLSLLYCFYSYSPISPF